MKIQISSLAFAFAALSLVPVSNAEAKPNRKSRIVASTELSRSKIQNESYDDDEYEDDSVSNARKIAKKRRKFEPNWYMRIQQLPLLGMASVSDNGVIDLELMKAVNENFHIGPKAIFHFGKQADTKMQSYNLGVRADFILTDVGNIGDLYLSSAFLIGMFQTRTKIVELSYEGDNQIEKVTCDFKSNGAHRVGAMAVGKLWPVSESIHITTGLGVVKTKTTGAITKSGQCSNRDVTESEGTELPWFDFGVGFRI